MWAWATASERTLWLAAYPRSGITMTRHLMLSCFGLRSDSLYTDDRISAGYAPILNAVPPDANERDEIAAQQGILPVKTHHLIPDNGQPAIVVVRDGRTTLQSLRDFYAELCYRTETVTDLIEGTHPWGDWSAWIHSWKKRPGALWIRYEDMRADLRATVVKIGEWLGREPVAFEMPSFRELNAAHPFFFRRGNRTNDWSAADEALFWARHGETMELLRYEKEQ